jgi:hypothetical protein
VAEAVNKPSPRENEDVPMDISLNEGSTDGKTTTMDQLLETMPVGAEADSKSSPAAGKTVETKVGCSYTSYFA